MQINKKKFQNQCCHLLTMSKKPQQNKAKKGQKDQKKFSFVLTLL